MVKRTQRSSRQALMTSQRPLPSLPMCHTSVKTQPKGREHNLPESDCSQWLPMTLDSCLWGYSSEDSAEKQGAAPPELNCSWCLPKTQGSCLQGNSWSSAPLNRVVPESQGDTELASVVRLSEDSAPDREHSNPLRVPSLHKQQLIS